VIGGDVAGFAATCSVAMDPPARLTMDWLCRHGIDGGGDGGDCLTMGLVVMGPAETVSAVTGFAVTSSIAMDPSAIRLAALGSTAMRRAVCIAAGLALYFSLATWHQRKAIVPGQLNCWTARSFNHANPLIHFEILMLMRKLVWIDCMNVDLS